MEPKEFKGDDNAASATVLPSVPKRKDESRTEVNSKREKNLDLSNPEKEPVWPSDEEAEERDPMEDVIEKEVMKQIGDTSTGERNKLR